jgi:hypothetical protein
LQLLLLLLQLRQQKPQLLLPLASASWRQVFVLLA